MAVSESGTTPPLPPARPLEQGPLYFPTALHSAPTPHTSKGEESGSCLKRLSFWRLPWGDSRTAPGQLVPQIRPPAHSGSTLPPPAPPPPHSVKKLIFATIAPSPPLPMILPSVSPLAGMPQVLFLSSSVDAPQRQNWTTVGNAPLLSPQPRAEV